MNIDNINKVIDLIKHNGQKHFNMHLYVGKLSPYHYNLVQRDDTLLASSFDPSSEINLYNEILAANPEDQIKDPFSCNTCACIAGFAVLANTRNNDTYLDMDYPASTFETIANNFFGFTYEEGASLYYGYSVSLWKYIYYMQKVNPKKLPEKYRSENFGSLEIKAIYLNLDANDYTLNDWLAIHEESTDIDYSSITYTMAITVLEDIRDGLIILPNGDSEYPVIKSKEEVLEYANS